MRLLRVFRAALSPGVPPHWSRPEKDARRLVLAYNDAAGVTAAFNLNLLARINRELGGDFDLAGFRHEAIYNPRHGRIEMHLVSRTQQNVTIGGQRFRSEPGETIHTENSYKYSIDQFRGAGACGRLAAATRVDRRGQLVQRSRARRRLGDRTNPKPCVRRALKASHAARAARQGCPSAPGRAGGQERAGGQAGSRRGRRPSLLPRSFARRLAGWNQCPSNLGRG